MASPKGVASLVLLGTVALLACMQCIVAQDASETCQMEGFYGSERNCRDFYRCVPDGNNSGNEAGWYSMATRFRKYDFQCPPGTIFDAGITGCNYPGSVNPKPKCLGNSQQEDDNA